MLTPFELSRPFDKGAGMKLRRLKFLGSAIISTVLLNGQPVHLRDPKVHRSQQSLSRCGMDLMTLTSLSLSEAGSWCVCSALQSHLRIIA